tara:strand:- start:738 stop:2258 length:1521 start_codon:yes stop_codon:yes gene_type:complete
MIDLIVDAPIVADACSDDAANLTKFLDSRRNINNRNWVYIGQKLEIFELLLGKTELTVVQKPKLIDSKKLIVFDQLFLWLAAIAEDGATLHELDPDTSALVKAANRLGKEARILTTNKMRLEIGLPFVDVKDVMKRRVTETSIPLIDLKVQQDQIRPNLERSIHAVLHHGQYVNGPEISKLELVLADFVGVKHCVCVSSGTDALLISLLSLGIGRGDEVVTTAFSFIGTAEAILLAGATPVFVDVDIRTGNMDVDQLEARITHRTRAILPVSLYGQTANLTKINEIARIRRLPVIEDGAQSFGAYHNHIRSCGATTIGCTSFFPAKSLGAYGDAGACFTNDASLAEAMQEVLNHGQKERYEHTRIGLNGRMDSLQAAVLLAKLDVFDRELEFRQRVADYYSESMNHLEKENKLQLPFIEHGNCSAWTQYTIQITDRDHVKDSLAELGVPTSVHYPKSLPDQAALSEFHGVFPNSEKLANNVLSLPMHPYLRKAEQKRIVENIFSVL